jgi:hypothetical protein
MGAPPADSIAAVLALDAEARARAASACARLGRSAA